MPLSWKGLSRAQWAVLAIFIAGWFALALAMPESSSVDVYLFRDAGVNWAQGHDFRTASFEKSTSFAPLLYTSYTPLVQWCFLPFAAIVHPLWRAEAVYLWALATPATLLVLSLSLPWVRVGWARWVLVILAGIALPAGWIAPEPTRPEALSLVLLLLLVKLLGGIDAAAGPLRWATSGLVAGLAFLSEPYAGVLGVLLIAGSALAAAGRGRPALPLAATRLLATGSLAGVLFLAPIALTAVAFEHADPTALARFEAQAKYAGTQRPIEYKMSADQTAADLARIHDSYEDKLVYRLKGDKQSLPVLLRLLGFLALAAGALLLAVSAEPAWPGIKLMAVPLLALTLLLPLLLFPLQNNYRPLTAAVAVAALAVGWAGLRIRSGAVLVGLVMLELLVALPSVLVRTISRVEVRASFMEAEQQSHTTASWLDAHGLASSVLLVPPSVYYAWKEAHLNIYNDSYYAQVEGTSAIGGLVRCKNATRDLSSNPLPPGIPGDWLLLSHEDKPTLITLAGRRLMRNNWTLGCDVYVRHIPVPRRLE